MPTQNHQTNLTLTQTRPTSQLKSSCKCQHPDQNLLCWRSGQWRTHCPTHQPRPNCHGRNPRPRLRPRMFWPTHIHQMNLTLTQTRHHCRLKSSCKCQHPDQNLLCLQNSPWCKYCPTHQLPPTLHRPSLCHRTFLPTQNHQTNLTLTQTRPTSQLKSSCKCQHPDQNLLCWRSGQWRTHCPTHQPRPNCHGRNPRPRLRPRMFWPTHIHQMNLTLTQTRHHCRLKSSCKCQHPDQNLLCLQNSPRCKYCPTHQLPPTFRSR